MTTIHSPLKFMTSHLLEKAGVGTLNEFLLDQQGEPVQVVSGRLYELTDGAFVADRRTVARWMKEADDVG